MSTRAGRVECESGDHDWQVASAQTQMQNKLSGQVATGIACWRVCPWCMTIEEIVPKAKPEDENEPETNSPGPRLLRPQG